VYGLGSAPDFENPAEALRRARVISLLESRGHSVDDLGDPSGFQFREIRDPETGIKDLDLWIELSRSLPIKLETILGRKVFPLLLGGVAVCRRGSSRPSHEEIRKSALYSLTVTPISPPRNLPPAEIPPIWNSRY